jgi:hypothetical protein
VYDVLTAIAPVFFVAAAGYGLRKAFPLDAKTLSTLNIYILIPCLVYGNLAPAHLDWGMFARLFAAAVLATAAATVVLVAIAAARGLHGPARGAFLMTMFPNLGNFGLPVVAFAFGDEALPIAVMVLVIGSFMQNNLGVYFAHLGRATGWKQALTVFRFPMIYAFAAALLMSAMSWETPPVLFRAIDLVAVAAVPVQLLVLGVQLAETKVHFETDVILASLSRLVLGPIFAGLAAYGLGLEAFAWQVFVIQMSGPVAVGMAVYGVQFQVRPAFLANAVALSFFLSFVTVAVTLYVVLHGL